MKKRTFIKSALAALFLVAVFAGLSLGRDRVWISVDIQGNFEPGDKIQARLMGSNYDSAELKLFRVDSADVMLESVKKGKSPGDLDSIDPGALKLLKKWEVRIDEKDKRRYGDNKKEFRVNKNIDIENPGLGVYIIQATGGGEISKRMFIVTGISAVVKADDTKVIVMVADRRSGEPCVGADVVFADHGGVKKAVTDADGIAVLEGGFQRGGGVAIEWDGNPAFVSTYFNSPDERDKFKVYVYTDRPAYRPGHTVHIRGIVRVKEGLELVAPGSDTVTVTIRDGNRQELAVKECGITQYGTFSAEYELKGEAALGYYSIQSRVGSMDFHSSFRVEEYRKPEYLVDVRAEKPVLVQGDELRFRVEAKYYFGEPVKAAPVRYTLYRRQLYYYWWVRPYEWYYEKSSRMIPYYGYHGEEVLAGEGVTDDRGVFSLVYGDTKSKDDAQYTLVARVMEKGRREETGIGAASVMRGEFRIGVRTDRYMSEPGEKVWIITDTKDLEGNGISRALDLDVFLVDWDGNKRTERKVYRAGIETSSRGEGRTEFVPDEPGYYEIRVKGTDGRDNVIETIARLHVSEPGWYRPFYSRGGMELILDRDSYRPGDVARLLINSGPGDVPALVTVEADRIMDYRVVDLRNGTAFVEIKVTEEFQPNCDISVVLMKDNRLYRETASMVVPPEERFLDVEIVPDRGEYRPGDTAHVKIEARDSEGNPVEAELSIGVVDESLFALYPESAMDIRQFFYGRRWTRVTTSSSLSFYSYGNADIAEESALPAEAPGMLRKEKQLGSKDTAMNSFAAGGFVEPEIRTEFPDTAYWAAHVVTGRDGRAQVSFRVPDSLTTWRLTSRGITRGAEVGQSQRETVAKKDVIVRLEAPRFFTQGDEQTLTAVVHNYLDSAKNVKTVLNAKGLRLLEKNERMIEVGAGGDVRVEWRVLVEEPQDAWVTVKALTDEESDAMQLTIPVLPHGSPGVDAAAGDAGDGAVFTLYLPEKYVDGTQKLELTLAPTLTAGMYGVFEYLAGYPYGCVEQTMSRFMPDVVIARAMQSAGRPLTGVLKELPEMVEKGFERLADMQRADGGWGWWKGGDANPMMTAYVVYGLSQSRLADYAPPAGMQERGTGFLEKWLADEENKDETNVAAYVVFALSEAGAAKPEMVTGILKNRKELTVYGLAVLAIAAKNTGMDRVAGELATELASTAEVSGSIASFANKKGRYGWMDNVVETTAYAVRAMLKIDPENELIPAAIRYLNVSRRGNRWYSTKDTAAALVALIAYMEKREDVKPDCDYEVYLNGKSIGSGSITAADIAGEGVGLDRADGLRAGKNEIKIMKRGKGSLNYYAALRYFEESDLLEPQDNGIKVKRYFSWDAEGKKRIKDRTRLRSGDVIWSHVVVTGGSDREYVMVENYLPSGFEVVRDDWRGGWYSYWSSRELRDEKVVNFINRMWRNEYEMKIPLKAETPGEVHAMPCVASLMYFPDVNGRSGEYRFIIEP